MIEFDGFDYLGKPTGKKVLICEHQYEDCEFQSPYGECVFLVCKCEECYKTKICNKEFEK